MATIPLAGPGDLPVVLLWEEPVAPAGIPEEKTQHLPRQRHPGLVAAVEPQPGSTGPTRSWRWRGAAVAEVVPGIMLHPEPDLQVAVAKVDRLTPTGVVEPAAEAPTTAGAGVGAGVDIYKGVRAEVCDPAGIPIRAETAEMPD